MNSDQILNLIAMMLYMCCVIGIGIFFAKRANKSSEDYFLGGRSLGPWVTAMSAEASDMSGWLLMGLPGLAYWYGIADAMWTAIGLAVGTYINWLVVARRLRRYSAVAGDAITLPDFFSARYREKKKIIMTVAALFILIFFTVYAASCFVTCGKLFSALFNANYQAMMILGALFVILYTFLGGFLAESASDFMQAIVMVGALSMVLVAGTISAGGLGAVLENAKSIDGFWNFFATATPTVDANGIQQVVEGAPQFGAATPYAAMSIISCMAWGLGYFGMPQVLLRFMAIRDEKELPLSRRIATVWVVVSLFAAVMVGVIGRALYPTELLTKAGAENVFIVLSQGLLPALLAGIVMAGILAATISSSDSYLLIAASAVSKNIFQGLINRKASDKQVMWVTRGVLIAISLIGILIALDEKSVIFQVVSFAWAGFGATFGPLMLFSLFWKRTTQAGALAGMLTGGGMVFVWKLVISKAGGIFAVYELFPAFVLSCLAIVVVSLLTPAPSAEICADFEQAKRKVEIAK